MTSSPERSLDRRREAPELRRWGWYSVALNVGLIGAHAVVAWQSRSLAVAAELVHNVVDLVAALAVLVGLHLASRTSERFPYGLHKVENLVAAGLAVLIFVSAYEITVEVLVGGGSPVDVSGWMLAVVALTTVAPLVFGHFELRVARLHNSPALTADAREYRIHAVTTGLVFAALVADQTGLPVDRVAAAVIVVVVVRAGWDVLRGAMSVLLDAGLDPATSDEIRRAIVADPAVRELCWMTGRNAGRFRFVEAGVSLRVIQPERVEVAVGRIESAVHAAVPHIDRVLVHVEPTTRSYVRYAVPLDEPPDRVSEHFGQAAWFAFVDVDTITAAVVDQRIVANPHRQVDKGKGIRVAEWLAAADVDVVVSREPLRGRGPAHVLGESGIELHESGCGRLADLLEVERGGPGG